MAIMRFGRLKIPIKITSSKLIDLTGQRFGRLVVVKREESDRRGAARWGCICDCRGEGGEFVYGAGRAIVRADKLRRGETLSCGCIAREATRQRALDKPKPKAEPETRRRRVKRSQSVTPVGDWRSPEPVDWQAFKDRALARALADLKR